jgi:hypothetical protein
MASFRPRIVFLPDRIFRCRRPTKLFSGRAGAGASLAAILRGDDALVGPEGRAKFHEGGLRYALNGRPKGRTRATLRRPSETSRSPGYEEKNDYLGKGTSIEVSRGTFLKWLDKVACHLDTRNGGAYTHSVPVVCRLRELSQEAAPTHATDFVETEG